MGLKEFAGLPWPDKERLLRMMRDAGVIWLQITGGEPTIDKHFTDAYRLAFELGMMITVSTKYSRLWHPDLLGLFTGLPPYRLVTAQTPVARPQQAAGPPVIRAGPRAGASEAVDVEVAGRVEEGVIGRGTVDGHADG